MVDFSEDLPGAIRLCELATIVDITNDLQQIQYYISKDFGRVLVINGELQHVEAWSPFYHEIAVHLPCGFIKHPATALIIGGGSLFAAEELLKYISIRSIELVDHDLDVVRATLKAYPERRHITQDRRLTIVNKKYQEFLPDCKNKYDIIINDCFDLYTETERQNVDYYKIIENLLLDEGICSDLIYRSIYNDDLSTRAIERIPRRTNKAASLIAVPEYPGIFHLLTMWGPNPYLSQASQVVINADQSRMTEENKFKIYNPKHIRFYLYLPPYLSMYI